MLVIHIIHILTKLFTLKRSREVAVFTLKRSRFSAETLPHSIYAFIYLYKNTCSYRQKSVNYVNKLKKYFSFSFLIIICFSLISCCCDQQQIICIEDRPIDIIKISQSPATKTQPAKFYVHRICNSQTLIFLK